MDDSQALLPTVIDDRARLEPERLYCAIIKSPDLKDGFITVTYGDFANAVNRCSWWLKEKFGQGRNYETLAYVGSTDLRYAIIALAAAKTGHKAMLISPANTIAAQVKLLEATECNVLLLAGDFPIFKSAVVAIQALRELRVVEFDCLDHWLAKEKVLVYPFQAMLTDDPRRPYVVLHTSGSTGLPEPITYTFAGLEAFRRQLSPGHFVPDAPSTLIDKWKDHRMYLPFPPFHMVGLLCTTATAVYWNMPPIMGPPNVLPTAELVSKIVTLDICQSAVISPAVLQEMAKNPKHLEALEKLDYVIWCGAPLPSVAVADRIRSHVNIYPAYGATECGALPLTVEDQKYHEWMNFNPIIGATLRHYSEDLYELVIVKDPKILPLQFVFLNFPELSEWPTKDLMSKHPTRDFWKYRGRRDDMIILSTGFQINPLVLEGTVMSHPRIISALFTGTGKTKAAWLIEVKEPPVKKTERMQLIEEIWPTIEKANQAAPSQARVEKEAIVFATVDKPMARAGKGSVQRQMTVKLYQQELNAVHEALTGP